MSFSPLALLAPDFGGLSFGRPGWLWALLLAPAAAAAAAWLLRRWSRAVETWVTPLTRRRLQAPVPAGRRAGAILLLAVAVAALVLGLARPRWGVEEGLRERSGLALVLVLDTSWSMSAGDVEPTRLEAARQLLRELVRHLNEGDGGAAAPPPRVALVQAEGEARVLSPLSRDGALLDLLLDRLRPGTLETPGSALASALERAEELFEISAESPSPSGQAPRRAILLVSDGEDHGGGLAGAGRRLAEVDITVLAVGVGTAEGARLPARHPEDGRWLRDLDGTVVTSRLDADGLEGLVRTTGGTYLALDRSAADPVPLLEPLAELARRGGAEETALRRRERHSWPLAIAAVARVSFLVLPLTPSPRRRHAAALAALTALALTPFPGPRAQDAPPSSVNESAEAPPASRWLHNPRQRAAAGRRALEQEDADAAARELLQAAALVPESAAAAYNAGTALAAGGDARAEAWLERSADLAAGAGQSALQADALYNRGNLELRRERWAAAVEHYRRALEAAPDHRSARHNLEWALRQMEPPEPPPAAGPQEAPPETADQGGEGDEEEGDSGAADESDGDQEDSESDKDEAAAGPSPRAAGRDPSLPQFEAQPELSPAQAAAILRAVESLEREDAEDATPLGQAGAPGGKPW